MPIDPSIILGLRQPEIKVFDPVESTGRSLALQGLMGQQQLQGLQIQTARQGLEDEQAQRRALIDSGGDNARYRALLAGSGQHKAVSALDKQLLETEEKRSVIDKNKAEIPLKQQELVIKAIGLHRDQLAEVNDPQTAAQWVAAGYQDPVMGPILQRQAGPLEQAISRIPQDPQGFQQWKSQNALGATKFIEANKPHVMTQDVGGTSQIVSTPGLGGAPTVLSTTAKTATPGEILADRRGRESQAEQRRHNGVTETHAAAQVRQGSSQIVTNEDGTSVLVDKATGVSRPVVDSAGQPLRSGKALTESQGKAAGMLHRATSANDILNGLEDKGENNRGIIKQAAGSLPLVGGAAEMGVNMLPSALGGPSSNQQRVEQARRDFVNAALRVESGAAISESEFRNAEKQYFPMPGDSKETLSQKRRNRETELEALKLQAGKQQPQRNPVQPTDGIRGKGILTPNADGSFNYGMPG